MKTLKFFALAICLFVMSQSLMAQVRVSPKVGVNLSGLDTKLSDFDAEARAGWHAGLDFRVGEGFIFLNPGVQYQSYTARLVQNIDENTELKFSDETTIQSLKAPLNLGIQAILPFIRIWDSGSVRPVPYEHPFVSVPAPRCTNGGMA